METLPMIRYLSLRPGLADKAFGAFALTVASV